MSRATSQQRTDAKKKTENEPLSEDMKLYTKCTVFVFLADQAWLTARKYGENGGYLGFTCVTFSSRSNSLREINNAKYYAIYVMSTWYYSKYEGIHILLILYNMNSYKPTYSRCTILEDVGRCRTCTVMAITVEELPDTLKND